VVTVSYELVSVDCF